MLVKEITRLVNETTNKLNVVESFGKTSRDIPQNIFAL